MSSEPSSNEVQGLRQQLASQRQALLASLLVSAWMVEARDPYTGGHLWRVARMAHALGPVHTADTRCVASHITVH